MNEQLIQDKEIAILKLQEEIRELKRDASPHRSKSSERLRKVNTDLFGPNVGVYFEASGELHEPGGRKRCNCPRTEGCMDDQNEFSFELEICHKRKNVLWLEMGFSQKNECDKYVDYGPLETYANSFSTSDYWKNNGWSIETLNRKLGEFLEERSPKKYPKRLLKKMGDEGKFFNKWDRELEELSD